MLLFAALLSLHFLSSLCSQSDRFPPPPLSDRFDSRSLQPALILKFGDGESGFTVSGRGNITSDDVDFAPGYRNQAVLGHDGVTFGSTVSGFVSVQGVDLRGDNFLGPPSVVLKSGLIFKLKYNFGNYKKFCTAICEEAHGATTCTGAAGELQVPAGDAGEQVLFSNVVPGNTKNLLFTITRDPSYGRDAVSATTCENTLIYTFTLYYGSSSSIVWHVYSLHQLWLEDGQDHDFILVSPRTSERDFSDNPWNLLYIDGKYICPNPSIAPTTTTAAGLTKRAAVADDIYFHCKETPVPSTELDGTNPWFAEEVSLTGGCPYGRFFFGSSPRSYTNFLTGTASTAGQQPADLGYPLYSATLKSVEVWNYKGILQPDDSFLCGDKDICSYYRGSPWCRNDPDYLDYQQWAQKDIDTSGCSSVTVQPVCADLGTASACSNPFDKCASGWSCCENTMDPYDRYSCQDLQSLTHCGICGVSCSGSETCCNGTCVDTHTDANNCYSCGNACPNDGECCPRLKGCTGSDALCTSCDSSSSCLLLNSAGTDYHCCPTSTSGFRCVDFNAPDDQDCGVCGNACGASQSCCSGDCVTIGDNENCAACGDQCISATGLPRACCNNVCVTLDTDDNCGSCGHDCGVIGLQQNKSLHCCDGLCVEWGVVQTSCGCPATDCEQDYNQRLGVTTYHCCVDALPPTTMPLCVDITSDAACGTCGNVCTGNSTCCTDAVGARQCLDLSAQDSCGACDSNCGDTDIASPFYCCSTEGDFSCVAVGTNTDCNACEDACANTTQCCPVIGFPVAGTPTEFACQDTTNDAKYCGNSCTDCTANGTIADAYCCNGVCQIITGDLAACGCEGACDPTAPANSIACCVGNSTGPGPAFVCTPLLTNDNCAGCGDVCDVSMGSQCCSVNDTFSSCLDTLTDNLNCGRCGRNCSETETCCNGECTDITTILDCNGCGTLCDENAEFCCDSSLTGVGPWGCQAYLTNNTSCGCPSAPVDCTMIVPPPENHDGNYTCCKGQCVPTWEDCVD